MQLVETNWPWLVAAILIGLVIAWWVFVASRRTRVTGDRRDVLDEGAQAAARNQALIDAPAAAVVPTTFADPNPAVSAAVPPAIDDLTRIKGVGPKLRDQLTGLGVHSFEQIAAWSEEDIDRIDAQLGRFEGRIRRDDWREQARLLQAGDLAAYESKFGKL